MSRRTELPLPALLDGYLTAFETVVRAGFAREIDEQERRRLDRVTESDFLREAAWVVLSAGMQERIVGALFPGVSKAFLQWESASAICRNRLNCARRASAVFAHQRKIGAIIRIAERVSLLSFEEIRADLCSSGVKALENFPYIGPVTKFHLAKNLGLDVAKPDRHLVRISRAAGFSDPARLCRVVAHATGDRVGTVDLVLWRYATIRADYQTLFRPMTKERRVQR